MAHITVIESPTAKRIKLVVPCDQCGHNTLEPLTHFHGDYMVVCKGCSSVVNLRAKENKIVIEELIKLCAKMDSALH
jgi:hypothetical protein